MEAMFGNYWRAEALIAQMTGGFIIICGGNTNVSHHVESIRNVLCKSLTNVSHARQAAAAQQRQKEAWNLRLIWVGATA